MPFEPLQTDERLEGPIKKEPDMDRMMLAGCTSFSILAFGCYLVAIWPFIIFPGEVLSTTAGLGKAFLVGCGPSLLLGLIAARRFGLAAAAGAVGGTLSVCVFLYLKMTDLMLGYEMRDVPKPEFPRAWAWQVPMAYFLFAFVCIVIFLPKKELEAK